MKINLNIKQFFDVSDVTFIIRLVAFTEMLSKIPSIIKIKFYSNNDNEKIY